jgi:DNA-binding NarL/FixJ family response regulator
MIVSGETDNIRDAWHKIQVSKPHLLLTALRLGTGDSLEFLKAAQIGASCFVDSRLFRFRGNYLRGACFPCRRGGLRDEKAPKEELLTAIREILSGNIYVSHDVAMRAFKKSLETRSEQQQRSARPTIGIEKLSDRETRIFFLLGSGLGNTQIANSLNLEGQNHREPS